MTEVVVIGGGGHAACLLDFLLGEPAWRFRGYLAPQASPKGLLGLPHLGSDDYLFRDQSENRPALLLGVAGNADNTRREELFERWTDAGFSWICARHPSAVIATSVTAGAGLQCLPGAVINGRVALGRNVLVNSQATIEHDCQVGDHVHVAPGATVCGGVTIEDRVFVGAGAVVVPGVRLGRGAIIGAGAVVIADVEAGVRAVGNPARPLREVQ